MQPDSYDHVANSITSCTTGLYTTADSTDVDSLTISGCTTGLYTASSAGGTFQDVDITGGSIAFNALASGSHTFREGTITGFTMYGVKTVGVSGVDLGTQASPGNNNIYSSESGVLKYVSVKYPLDGIEIMAEQNWWGQYPAPSAKFSAGVDYTPERQSLSTLGRRVGITMGPLTTSLLVRPNPSSGAFTLEYVVPRAGEAATLEVFDVAGRRVWALREEAPSLGRHTLVWEGRDVTDRVLPSGIYFLRYRVGADVRTARIVRITR